MRSLNIVARFPLGVYVGHKSDGRSDEFPDPARLHAALLNSAAQGTHAVQGKHGLEPSESALVALKWLEKNPPDGIEKPTSIPVFTGRQRFMHREVAQSTGGRKTELRPLSDGVALASHIGWQWHNVPDDIAETLEQLCDDVPHLGESASIVVLERGEVAPNLHLDVQGSPLVSGGMMLRVPIEGRTDALINTYKDSNPNKVPNVAMDKPKKNEEPLNMSVTHECLGNVKYSYRAPIACDAPWSQIVLLEVAGEELPSHQYVAICVTLHRAIISAIGFGASSFITGKYDQAVGKIPANRLAFQYLPVKYTQHLGLKGAAIAIMIPSAANAEDLTQLANGLATVKSLYSREFGRRHVYFSGISVQADEFWPEPLEGSVRLWKPLTAIVPETRPVKTKDGAKRWTLADSGLLSLAYVWRDRFNSERRGEQRYLELRDQVKTQEAVVFKARTINAKPRRYAHRTHASVVTQPWRGLLSLGTLATDKTLVAIGQSRHLGGGLLVPHDVSEDDFERMIQKEKHNNDK
ncbi:type I-U CRISPR-associated protein Csb2 [Corynebacterium durum]|nr:type I-U CRISPR-associated protein Csb2 [Corynebacterium durum]